ncbi:MAG: MBL fold metallo-hydrolase [Syntrophales bacterium]|jgi:glyoxylase-like metal-dependent hydrolase (beta-lactamase superfamily II)
MEEIRFGNLVFIPGMDRGKYPFCNSLYIDDKKKAIIDPASDESFLRKLAREKKVDIIINSHYHEDHIAFNYLFPEAELYVHEAIGTCFKSYSSFLEYCGLLNSKYRAEWDDLFLNRFHFEERTPAVEFGDGDLLIFGDTKLRVIHTPGHTVGHCSFHFPDQRILFMGDLDLSQFGPWYGDRVSDIDQTIQSMRRLLEIPADIYITSHETGIIRGDITDLVKAYLDVIAQREKKILEFLERPRTVHEIVEHWIIFKRELKPRYFFEFAERGMIIKHLARLIKNGNVGTEKGKFYFISSSDKT